MNPVIHKSVKCKHMGSTAFNSSANGKLSISAGKITGAPKTTRFMYFEITDVDPVTGRNWVSVHYVTKLGSMIFVPVLPLWVRGICNVAVFTTLIEGPLIARSTIESLSADPDHETRMPIV